MKQQIPLQKQTPDAIVETQVPTSLLSTRNLDELMPEIEDLERRITPFLNKLRAMQGKKPLLAPKE